MGPLAPKPHWGKRPSQIFSPISSFITPPPASKRGYRPHLTDSGGGEGALPQRGSFEVESIPSSQEEGAQGGQIGSHWLGHQEQLHVRLPSLPFL
jgi:hypothetical protein